MTVYVDSGVLTNFSASLLMRAGVPESDALVISRCLVEANLRGTDSHGVMRLPTYVKRFRSGATNPEPSITMASETVVASLVDGDNGLGHLVGTRAMEKAIQHAAKAGIGLAVARNSNHYGAASYFALMAAEQGMVGYSASNTCPAMPAPGSKSAVVGNGPFSIALPALGGESVCLDASTSAGAYGKVLIAEREGTAIPEGWALDVDGRPTTDPKKAIESQLLLPFAAHKGFGIAFMIDALCAALGNTWVADEVPNIYEDGKEHLPGRVSHFFLAISSDLFGAGQAFKEKVERMKQFTHEALRIEDQSPKYPGEIEAQCKRERLRDGVPLSPALQENLSLLANEAGVKTAWEKK